MILSFLYFLIIFGVLTIVVESSESYKKYMLIHGTVLYSNLH